MNDLASHTDWTAIRQAALREVQRFVRAHRKWVIAATVWFIFLIDWLCFDVTCLARWTIGPFASGELLVQQASTAIRWLVFTAALGVVAYACWRTWKRDRQRMPIVATLALPIVWHWLVFAFSHMPTRELAVASAQVGTLTAFFVGLAWVVYGVERGAWYYRQRREQKSTALLPLFLDDKGNVEAAHYAVSAIPQTVLENRRRDNVAPALAFMEEKTWNPIDLEAWYYGRRTPKLNQSLATMTAYTIAFVILVWLFNMIGGCQEIYEMPAGGGGTAKGNTQNTDQPQTVQVKRIIRKKFVINPFSAVLFSFPPVEEVPLNLKEATKHGYQIGHGKGEGAGFSGGTNRGKVRFIRLEYKGGDWDQDFGVGTDLNMLLRYGIETGHQIAEKTESRTIEELARFPIGKSPPYVYMTGQRAIQLTKREFEILREYLLDKHGMIFCDNGGSSQFHSQFFAVMDKVLEGTGVYPVKVPLDDVIHRVPFTLPFLPYVAPHGGKDAWGWYKDGRWLAYYHPGDIGDAWADGHAGVRKDIYESCYQLGVNVIYYAHAEYNKWLASREKKE